MAKITYNKYHGQYEVYMHRKGKIHIGYYTSKWKAQMVVDAVNKVV